MLRCSCCFSPKTSNLYCETLLSPVGALWYVNRRLSRGSSPFTLTLLWESLWLRNAALEACMQHSLYTKIWSPPAPVMHLLKAELQPPPAVCQGILNSSVWRCLWASQDIGDVTRHVHPLISGLWWEEKGVSINWHVIFNVCYSPTELWFTVHLCLYQGIVSERWKQDLFVAKLVMFVGRVQGALSSTLWGRWYLILSCVSALC